MPLTPEDVSNKRFTPVRLREGYDMGEVDQFLDEVEAELARLTQENDDLRAKLAAAQSGGSGTAGGFDSYNAPTQVTPAQPEPPVVAPVAEEPEPEPVVAPVVAAPAPAATSGGIETIRVETVPEASNAAARLLEIATRNADELVEEAKAEADRLVGEAKGKAERLENEAKGKADRLEADARTRAEMLDGETAERRTQLFGDLEKERDKLSAEVENLRSFEREYRSRLKSYFTQQLDALQVPGDTVAPASDESPAPKRLRSILGEENA
ncbi:DivIVA domain-containing protein [Nocardioides maradonensis]